MLWVQRFWLRLQTLFGRNLAIEALNDYMMRFNFISNSK